MKTARQLLVDLGINNCTDRHIRNINDFISGGEGDIEKLLDKLGEWDGSDLKIAKLWQGNEICQNQ